jgi:hypothetical protein
MFDSDLSIFGTLPFQSEHNQFNNSSAFADPLCRQLLQLLTPDPCFLLPASASASTRPLAPAGRSASGSRRQ